MVAGVSNYVAEVRERRYPDCASFQADLEEFLLSTGKPMGAAQIALLVAMMTAGSEGPMPLGQKTSSGEPYDMYKMTAAHPTLPIPSYARVTNLANGRSVVVRINDRGPFHGSRIWDLTYATKRKLGFGDVGTAARVIRAITARGIEPSATAGSTRCLSTSQSASRSPAMIASRT